MDFVLCIVLLLIIVLICFCVYYVNKNYLKKWKIIDRMPGPKRFHPIYGNFQFPITLSKQHNWTYRSLEWIQKVAHEYGSSEGVIRMWIGPVAPIVILTKPETAQIVLSSPANTEKAFIYNVFKYFLGSGLGTSRSTRWRYNRKLLNPAFSYNVLQNFLPIINTQQNVLMDVIDQQLAKRSDGIIPDIRPLVSFYVMDSICETAMGYKLNCQVTGGAGCEYVSNLHKLFEIAAYICIRPWYWFSMTLTRCTKAGKLAEKCVHQLHAFTDHVIEQRKNEKSHEQFAFIDILLAHHRSHPQQLSHYHVRSEVDTFMFAGHHTNGSSIVWTLLLIGNHPEVQKKVHEEIDAVFSSNSDEDVITMDNLRNLKYLEACVRESLRLYPVAPFIARQTTEELQCGQYLIPADSCVAIFIYHIHRLEEYWPNANEFIPERFLQSNNNNDINTNRHHSYAFLPFSAGPRSCIGQKYGLMQQKAVLAKLLKKFSIKSMIDMNSIEIAFDFVLYANSEIPIQFELRSK